MTKLLYLSILLAVCIFSCTNNTDKESQKDTETNVEIGPVQPVAAYADWDEDADAQLNPQEFTTYFTEEDRYSGWDADSNGTIEMQEWAGYYNQYYPQYSNFDDGASFEDWDANGDDVLEEEEFHTGTFDFWDTNEDGYIDEAEYMSHNYVVR